MCEQMIWSWCKWRTARDIDWTPGNANGKLEEWILFQRYAERAVTSKDFLKFRKYSLRMKYKRF